MAERYLLHYFKTGSLLDIDFKTEFEGEPVFQCIRSLLHVL